jgi:DNA polymerase-1
MATPEKNRLFLVDGPSYAYRSYYAIRGLANSQGTPTNAVFGFANTLNKLIADFSPDYLLVAFDAPGPTFRHEKYVEYKSHRKPMPDDLATQIPLIKELISAFRIPTLEKEGFEADDIMGTLALRAQEAGLEVYLVTGDKDMFQLVNQDVKILHTHKNNKIYDRQQVLKQLGIQPHQFIDVLALAGDASDNIPGVPGIGEKTALALVREFGDLESVLANIDRIPGEKRKENLRNHARQARDSRELAVLDTDVPLELNLESARFAGPDKARLRNLYERLEFRRLLNEITEERTDWQADYRLVSTHDALAALLDKLSSAKEVVVDVETTSLDPFDAELVGVSFSFQEGQAHYIPCNAKLARETILAALKPLLERKDLRIIGQNIKFDMEVLAQNGIEMNSPGFDTMVAAYILHPERKTFNLGSLSAEYLKHKMIPISDLIGTGPRKINMGEVPIEKVCRYSCEDADVTLRLKNTLVPELHENELDDLYYQIEIPLIPVLARMERNGVFVDPELLGRMSHEFHDRLNQLRDRVFQMAGQEFNLDSPKQLSAILFDKLNLPVQKRAKTGPSTDMSVLEKLARIHDLPKIILDYRELAKLKSTYADALPSLINPMTGRIHTSFNQTVTATGRLSSSNPNLQNIPVRTELGRGIRGAFVPERKGWLLLSADYSQIELRIFAHLAREEAMIRAFARGEDIHSYTASLMYGVPVAEVTPEMRNRAKAVNFGIIYGQQAFGLSNQLKISVSEAESFLQQYYARYPAVKRFMEETVAGAEQTGHVTTLFHRKREIPQLKSSSLASRQNGRRMAINTPIQGSAADIIKVAMINIDRRLRETNLRAMMIIQIHDELVFEVPQEEVEPLTQMVIGEMESVIELCVPIKADIKVGNNWAEI